MATQPATASSKPNQSLSAIGATRSYTRPLTIVTTLFFMWGFLTLPQRHSGPASEVDFDLSYARAMLVQFAFFSVYFLFFLQWSKIVNTIGYQKTVVVRLLTMAELESLPIHSRA